MKYKTQGFTLIELLVVVSIISLLSSIVFASLNSARQKARVAKRQTELKQIQTALEIYYSVNNTYPQTGWRSQCPSWGSYAANDVIPGLAPTYIANIPTDAAMDTTNSLHCYLYRSGEADNYKFMLYNAVDMTAAQITQSGALKDPRRNGPSAICGTNEATVSLAVWSGVGLTGGQCY